MGNHPGPNECILRTRRQAGFFMPASNIQQISIRRPEVSTSAKAWHGGMCIWKAVGVGRFCVGCVVWRIAGYRKPHYLSILRSEKLYLLDLIRTTLELVNII